MSKGDQDIYLEEDADAVDNTRTDVTKKIEKLKKRLSQCEEEKKTYLDNWQRAQADFVNARRIDEDEKKRAIQFATKNLIKEIIPILDSFFAAQETDDWNEGMERIFQQFKSLLKAEGADVFGEIGDEFDPYKHEALATQPGKEGTIITIVQKGYVLNGEVLRSAKVIVGA